MTSINIPRDDAARINPRTLADEAVKETAPYPRTKAVTPHDDVTQAPRRQQPSRQKQQRRKGDRRKQNKSVLLDTRSGHDRRNAMRSRQEDSDDKNNDTGSTGIDVYS